MPSIRSGSRHAVVALGLTVLLVLAGCGGQTAPETVVDSPAPATDDSTTTPASTTPASTTTGTTTATPTDAERLPPGIDGEGVENATAVLAAHRAQTVATAGVVTHTTNATLVGRSVRSTVRASATADLRRALYRSRTESTTGDDGRRSVTVVAANETTVRQYTAADGNVTLDNRQNRSDTYDLALGGLTTAANPLRGALQRGEFTVAEIETVDGETVVTLRADRYVDGQLFDPAEVETYSATLRIAANGTVLAAEEDIVGTAATDGRYYHFDYRFEPGAVDLPAAPVVPEDARVAGEDGGATDATASNATTA